MPFAVDLDVVGPHLADDKVDHLRSRPGADLLAVRSREEVEALLAKEEGTETEIHGWKVKTRFTTLSPDEKQARQKRISKTIAEAARRRGNSQSS